MSELKPCPFCGSEGKLEGGDYIGGWNEKTGKRPYRVNCTNNFCMASYMIGASFDNANEAIEAWNRRAEGKEIEPLTDKEQRRFLSAMRREEKVSEEMDRKYIREYSRVNMCREITRKVKGALWT